MFPVTTNAMDVEDGTAQDTSAGNNSVGAASQGSMSDSEYFAWLHSFSKEAEEELNEIASDIFMGILDDAIFMEVIEEHRRIKLGLHNPYRNTDQIKKEGLVDAPGLDVFGKQPSKVPATSFPCPNCGTMRLPTKFAPHLEKCMGMGGRESKRVAANRSRQQAEDARKQDDLGDVLKSAGANGKSKKRMYDAL
eukprot:m.30587 g.30587  ORF g.30587 m.30587 type:complete len:193 (-) comp8214_c0_seq2:77-655(-)